MKRSGICEEEIEFELHELCQPLTTLRCRLELALLQGGPDEPGAEEALREAVTEGVEDMRRAFASVKRLRLRLMGESPQAE